VSAPGSAAPALDVETSTLSAIDSKIDELYQKPLHEFTASRNALAKTLSGADATRTRALTKPTVVAWTVNQLYWQARATYDRLRAAGERLRKAQIATLKGQSADVRGASEAHRKAIADAAARAAAIAEKAGPAPDADELSRTLEALSVAAELPEAPGRLTRALKPAGFEALTGVSPAAARKSEKEKGKSKKDQEKKAREAQERREQEARKRAEIDAEAARDRAAAAESQTRRAWERAKRDLDAAERRLELVRSNSWI
jgi:colicin import membrane protein